MISTSTKQPRGFSGVRIGTRLAMLVAALIGLIALAILAYFPQRAQLQAEQALARRAHDIGGMMAFAVRTALAYEDVRSIEQAVAEAKQNQDLAFMVVTRSDSSVAWSYAITTADAAHYRSVPSGGRRSDDGLLYCSSSPVYNQGTLIGHVHLGLSLASFNAELNGSRKAVSIVALIVFLVGVGLAFGIGRVITRPLSTLITTIEHIAGGELDQRAPVVSRGELGRLATSFNVMADNIESAHRTLEGMNHVLEERVDERTHTLLQEVKVRRRMESELQETLALLHATLEATADGILVVEEGGTISQFNRRFTDMWRIPDDLVDTRDDSRLLQFVLDQLLDPEAFRTKVRELYGDPDAVSQDTLYFRDGRVFERYSHPLNIKQRIVGRVWTFVDVTEQKQAEDRILASLGEKEVLLKEIHHRVKNNLQVISSLLNLQSGAVADARDLDLLREGQNRVRSMALIHENLYRSPDLSQVNFHEYVGRLVSSLAHTYKVDTTRIAVSHDANDVALRIDAAIPCGLIINELVSNSFKHGFPDGRSGSLQVRMYDADGTIRLHVDDTGIGLPAGFNAAQTTSLGLQLVHTLTEQLRGVVTVSGTSGAAWTISFPA